MPCVLQIGLPSSIYLESSSMDGHVLHFLLWHFMFIHTFKHVFKECGKEIKKKLQSNNATPQDTQYMLTI